MTVEVGRFLAIQQHAEGGKGFALEDPTFVDCRNHYHPHHHVEDDMGFLVQEGAHLVPLESLQRIAQKFVMA